MEYLEGGRPNYTCRWSDSTHTGSRLVVYSESLYSLGEECGLDPLLWSFNNY